MQDFQDLTARMTRYASDLMDVWFQLIELAAAGRAPMAPPGTGNAQPTETAAGAVEPATPPATRVSVEVTSVQPVEVSVDVRPGSAALPLIVHALRAAEADKPRLGDVTLEPAAEPGTLRLRVRIPPDQPPGVYNGLVIDQQTSRPAGTVSVRVGSAG